MPPRPRLPLARVTRSPATSGPAWRPIRIARRSGGTSATTCGAGSRRIRRVLELGAGWCDFANNIGARRVVAMDLDETVRRAAAPQVQAELGDCTDLSRFADGEFDVVFASNLLEHLERPAASALLAESARVLGPGGRLILLQPNFRLNPGAYFDDYTHVAIYTDRSLPDYLVSRGVADRARSTRDSCR